MDGLLAAIGSFDGLRHVVAIAARSSRHEQRATCECRVQEGANHMTNCDEPHTDHLRSIARRSDLPFKRHLPPTSGLRRRKRQPMSGKSLRHNDSLIWLITLTSEQNHWTEPRRARRRRHHGAPRGSGCMHLLLLHDALPAARAPMPHHGTSIRTHAAICAQPPGPRFVPR